MKCPKHIENNVISLPNNNKFIEYEHDEYHLPYLVKCKCGCEELEIMTNPEPRILARCPLCGEKITIYNLRYYPAASLIPYDGENETYISPAEDTIFNIYVVYEYPELEGEEVFNPNDITWCEVYGFGIESKNIFQIINHETA